MPTARQQQVLDFVLAHHEEHDVFPSLREIQAHFGFASPFAVTRHLQALEQKGLLQRQAGKARAFTSPSLARRSALLSIPLYGTIPAGLPAANEQEPDDTLAIDAATLGVSPGTPLFALRVRGDSMTGANIIDGDIVFVTPRPPVSGQIVAALIDGESTLKRFVQKPEGPILRAENPRYPDLLPADELIIQGTMIGLLRPAGRPGDGAKAES